MARQNRTQFAILSFLASKAGTGYDIRQWLEGISSIISLSFVRTFPLCRGTPTLYPPDCLRFS